METFVRCGFMLTRGGGQILLGNRIECLPNPTTNQTLLRWADDMDRIEVISETGQRVLTYNVAGLQQKIVDMSTMPAGIYFVRFLVDNSVVATKKLIKR